MAGRDVVVIGTSAGGMEALKSLLSSLPPGFPAAMLIVWHMAPDQPSVLPQVLDRVSALSVTQATDGDTLQAGRVYTATPNCHLVLEAADELAQSADFGRVRVTHGPKENLFRPSIDVLFRSAARFYGSRVIGVVLTGMLDDGAAGLHAIKERGGLAVVQDPVDALYPSMPISAMKAVAVDYSVPLSEMGPLLTRLIGAPAQATKNEGGRSVSQQMEVEVKIALEDRALEIGVLQLGQPSVFTCPECHGTLIQMEEGHLTRFRCHTGHAFSLQALLSGVTQSVEEALWNALRVIEENELLLTHTERHLRESGQTEAADMFLQKARSQKTRRIGAAIRLESRSRARRKHRPKPCLTRFLVRRSLFAED